MKDFFVSYTRADQKWAEWIAYVLEEEGFATIIQAWDFRPGGNFILEMQEASKKAQRTIMVLSPAYLKSRFAAPEWAAAFVKDPQGLDRKLVPVMVHRCAPEGVLPAVTYIDLVDCEQDEAPAKLIGGVRDKRAKPSQRPAFPGKVPASAPSVFPGPASDSRPREPAGRSIYMPAARTAATDVDKRRFVRDAFETIRQHIGDGLAQLGQRDGFDVDFQNVTATEFTAEIFLRGKSVSQTRIWQGGLAANNGIAVAEGPHHHGSNSCNEILSVLEEDGNLFLGAMMSGSGDFEKLYDLKRLTPQQAGDYLWRRLVAPVERQR